MQYIDDWQMNKQTFLKSLQIIFVIFLKNDVWIIK